MIKKLRQKRTKDNISIILINKHIYNYGFNYRKIIIKNTK